MRIAYIASLARSGSTLMDMMLSCHPRIVGLGEVDGLIDPERRPGYVSGYHRIRCSCGAVLKECPVWGRYGDYLANMKSEAYVAKYKALIEIVTENHGEDVMIADSSKYPSPLSRMLSADWGGEKPDVRVIHLVKDVRSWTLACEAKEKKNGGLLAKVRRFREWRKANEEIESVAAEKGARIMRVGYEELCMYPEHIMRRVLDFLDLDFDDRTLDLSNSDGHIGLGNPMRSHPKKSRKLYYDQRWFTDDEINLVYALYPSIKRYNVTRVYENIIENQGAALFEPM